MAVRIECSCGGKYDLRNEFAGKLVACPKCGTENRAPELAVPDAGSTDRAFDRDVFLLRQQALKINAKYDVSDDSGNKILFVERPAHFLRSLVALLAAFIVFICVITLTITVAEVLSDAAAPAVIFIGMGFGFVAAISAAIALSAKRHVTFYRDQGKTERMLEIIQDAKFQPVTMTYTVRDPNGQTIALLWKNWLYNIVRKRWYVKTPDGVVQYLAKEDSIILSLLRRVLGPMLGLLRTNFIIVRPDSDKVLGEFNRKLTILDRYSLDMRGDASRTMDRRVALALGVMLDTGERR
jgi:hypothetical protein